MKKATLILLVVLLPFAGLSADYAEKNLRVFLAKSTLVISGTIKSIGSGRSEEAGVISWLMEFEVKETLHGIAPKEKTLAISILRLEVDEEDQLPYMKKGARCILFLRKSKVSLHQTDWITADPWFGVQPYNKTMAILLKRLSKEAKPKKQS